MNKKIKFFEYSMTPTEENEIVVTFKVGDQDYEMKLPHKTLKDILSLIDLKTLCLDYRREEKNPGLDVCRTCYHKRIWG